MKENLNPSPTMKSDCTQRLLTAVYNHVHGTNRRAQLGAFTTIYTTKKGIIFGIKFLNLIFINHEN